MNVGLIRFIINEYWPVRANFRTDMSTLLWPDYCLTQFGVR